MDGAILPRMSEREGSRRVVVTGMGAVTPVGLDVPSTWDAVIHGRSGVALVEAFDTSDLNVRIAGEVKRIHSLGIEVAMVIGGGNMWRGADAGTGVVQRSS